MSTLSSQVVQAETQITDRRISFRAPMVRAILAGNKTQTRRIIKMKDGWRFNFGKPGLQVPGIFVWFREDGMVRLSMPCPYGEVGTRLWVRERLAVIDSDEPGECCGQCVQYVADGQIRGWTHDEDGLATLYPFRSKSIPSVHMPCWASRITLEITDVRVEKIQDISNQDAKDEGIKYAAPARLSFTDSVSPVEIADDSGYSCAIMPMRM
jgi:hypothetical protein